MLSSKTKRELKIDQRQILIDSIEIGIPSPQQILNWGERTLPNGKRVGLIKNSKTVNYKRFTPFRDGLFCERIFGPVTSFVCACGKKQSHSKITFCEKCEVEYIDSRSRRYRLGYISLLSPVTHIWYLKGRPGYLSLFLGKRKKTVVALAYCNAYLISHGLSKKNISVKSDYRDQKGTYKSSYKSSYKSKICTCKGTKGKSTKISLGTASSLWPFMRSTSNINSFLQNKKRWLPLSSFDFKASCATKSKTFRAYSKKGIISSTKPGTYYKFCFTKQPLFCSMTNPRFAAQQGKVLEKLHFAQQNLVRRFDPLVAYKYKSKICKKICMRTNQRFVRRGNPSEKRKAKAMLCLAFMKTRVKLSFSSPKKTKLFFSTPRKSGVSFVAERNSFPVNLRKGLFLSNTFSTSKRQKLCLKFCQKKTFIAQDSITFLQKFVLKEGQRKEKKKIKKERYSSCQRSAYSPYFYARQQTLPFLPSLVCHFYLRDALLNFSHSVATPEDFPLMEYCDTKKWEPLRDVHRFMAHRTVEAFKDDLSYGMTRSKKAFRGPRFFKQKLDVHFGSLHTNTGTRSRLFFGNTSPNASPSHKSTIYTTGLGFCSSKASNFCLAFTSTSTSTNRRFVRRFVRDAKQKNVKEAFSLPAAFEVGFGKNKTSRFFLDKSKKKDSIFGFVGRARKTHFGTVRAYKSEIKTVRPTFFIDQFLGMQKMYAEPLPPNNDQSINILGKNELFKQKLFFENKPLNRVSKFRERKAFCKNNKLSFTTQKIQPPFQIRRSPKLSPSMKDTANKNGIAFSETGGDTTDFTSSERKITLSEETNKSALSGLELIAIREILSYTGGGALQQLLQQFNPHELSKFLFAEAQILRVLYETKSATEIPKGNRVSFVKMESLKSQKESITSPEVSCTNLLTNRRFGLVKVKSTRSKVSHSEASTKNKIFREGKAESNIRHLPKFSSFSVQKAKAKFLVKSYERLKQNVFFSPAKPIQNIVSFVKGPRKMELLLSKKTVQPSFCLAECLRHLQIRNLYEENKKQNAKRFLQPTSQQFQIKKPNKSFEKRGSTLLLPWAEPRKKVSDLFCSTYGFSFKTKPFYQSGFKQIYNLLVRNFASRTNLLTNRKFLYKVSHSEVKVSPPMKPEAIHRKTVGSKSFCFASGITYKSSYKSSYKYKYKSKICKKICTCNDINSGFAEGITYKSPICNGFAEGITSGEAKVTSKKRVYEAKPNDVKGPSVLTDRLLAFKGPTDVQKKQIVRISRRIYKVARRLKIASLLTRNHRKPEWMILSHLPVLPPDLRPILQMSEKVIVASDLNIMYQRVIYRNNRHLRVRFIDFHLVTAIQRLVQDAVDRLIENGKGGTKPYYTQAGRPLKSLSDILKGKKGRFRLNLLGKRVDFSGRSVIVVSPLCQIHECGLPKEIALELYHYFLLRTLIVKRYCASIVTAKKMIKSKSSKMWEILRILMYHHPVLLNRAPTLHRLGIQAFQPKLVLGNAIALHPLVCSGFNADFDGDQMGVHLPLSFAARAESLDLLWSRNNLLSPATGQPMLVPSQDMVLGFYYMTARGFVTPNKKLLYNQDITSKDSKTQVFVKESSFAEDSIFGLQEQRSFQRKTAVRDSKNLFLNVKETTRSFETGKIKLHQPIWLYWRGKIENDEGSQKPLELRVRCFGIQNSVYEKYISKNVFTKTQAKTSTNLRFVRVGNDQNSDPCLSKMDFTGVIKELSKDFAGGARANLSIADQSISSQEDSAPPVVSIQNPFKFYLKPEVCFIRTTAGRVLMNNLLKTKKDSHQF